RARHVGKQRTADHRTRPTHVLPPRPSDHVAAVSADSGTRLGGALEVGDPPAHENGIAPPDRDVGGIPAEEKLRSFPRKRESSAEGWVPATGSPRRERRGAPLAGTSGRVPGNTRHYPTHKGLGAARAMRYYLEPRTIRDQARRLGMRR